MRAHVTTRFAAVATAAAILAGCPTRQSPGPEVPDGTRRVRMEIFFMSQCPYSAKLMKILPQVLADMGGAVDLRLHAVIRDLGGGEYAAMHGPQELFGNVIGMCAASHSPDDLAKADFMACMSSHIASIPFGWEDCAERAGIPTDPIKACALGSEATELLEESFRLVTELNVLGSPYVFIDGVPHNLKLSEGSLVSALCCALEPGGRPEACPEQPPCYNIRVDVTVVTDARCDDCLEIVEETLSMFLLPFPLLEVEIVDYTAPSAAGLFEKTRAEMLPAFLFHPNVKESAAFELIEDNVYEAGGYIVVFPEAVDATFDPRLEICTNGEDDTGNGLVDCDDPDCKERITCRTEVSRQLDLFTMSMCPFGNEAMNASHDVFKHFQGAYTIKLHWISTVLDAGKFSEGALPAACVEYGGKAYCSLHGPEETAENLRQICAQSLYAPDKFFSYIKCMTNPKMELEWTECAAAAGLEATDMETCSTSDEGHDLLAADARLGDLLGVDASPMYLWNNTDLEGVAFTPSAIAGKACETNPDLPGCDKVDALEKEGMPVPPEAKCFE